MLPPEVQQPYSRLKAEMDRRDQVAAYNYKYDTVHCPGDGNRDGVVNQTDLDLWTEIRHRNRNAGVAQSSWYDLNHDGTTDGTGKDRKSVVTGQSGDVRVESGGRG